MNILVCIKQTEHNTLRPDRSAVEAALRLKALTDSFIRVICIGKSNALSQVREAISLGCDEGVLVCSEHADRLDAAACAKLLSAVVSPLTESADKAKPETFDVIFTSCYAADADAIQTGLLLAGLLGIPHASFISEVCPEQINPSADEACVLLIKRQIEDRHQLLHIKTPCLISALPLLGKPIYATADGITRAYTADIKTVSDETLLPQFQVSCPEALLAIVRRRHFQKEARRKGTVLTVSTEEAVDAVLAKIREHHLL